MNLSSVFAVFTVVAFVALLGVFGADRPERLIDVSSIFVVAGGTFAATLLSYSLRDVQRMFKLVFVALRREELHTQQDLEELVRISRMWANGEIRAVEAELDKVTNPFLRTGVQLVIDGAPEEDIHELLQWRIARLRVREAGEAQMFRSMASYAPAFGMFGTLLGLVNLMDLLGKGDIRGIGQQLAVALLTTLYGVLLANLVFKPLATRLERRTERRLALMNMVMEGVSMMRAGRAPSLMRETLKSFVAHFDDEIFDPEAGRAPATSAAPAVKTEGV